MLVRATSSGQFFFFINICGLTTSPVGSYKPARYEPAGQIVIVAALR
jgi:hypothetical protein